MSELLDDKRKIKMVWELGMVDGEGWHVGDSVLSITVYEEKGPSGMIPYFRLHTEDGVLLRLPAWGCGLIYFEDGDT